MPKIIKPAKGSFTNSAITVDSSGRVITAADGDAGGLSWQATVKTSAFSASANEGYFCDTSGGTFKVTLPAGSAGAIVALADFKNSWGGNHLTVESNGTEEIHGTDSVLTLKTTGASVELVYVDDSMGWVMTMKNGEGAVTQVTGSALGLSSGGNSTITNGDFKTEVYTSPGNFTINSIGNPSGFNMVDYFICAGGGGAGFNAHGQPRTAGGAGGIRQSNGFSTGGYNFTTKEGSMSVPGLIVTAQTYAVVVGAGGAAPGSIHSSGSSGSNSSFGGIVATGGGGSNSVHGPGPSGGCGGSAGGIHGPSVGGLGNPSGFYPSEGEDGFDGGTNGAKGGSYLQGGLPNSSSEISDTVSCFTNIAGKAAPSSNRGPFGRGGHTNTSTAVSANSGGGGNSDGSTVRAGGSGIVMIRYKFQ